MKKQLLLTLVTSLVSLSLYAQQPLNPGENIKSYYTSDIIRCRGDVKQNPNGIHATLGVTYDLNKIQPQNFRIQPGKGSGTFSTIRYIGGATARSSRVEIDYTLSNDDLFKESIVIELDFKVIGSNLPTTPIQFVIRYQGPFVYAGKDLYKCTPGEFELNSSYFSEGTSNILSWKSVSTQSVFGSYSTVNGNIKQADYTPNQTEITNGYADFVLMSTESKISCPNDSDTLRVHFNLEPSIEAGDTVTDNFNDSRVALTAQPDGDLVYKWYSGNTTLLLKESRNYYAYVGGPIRLEVSSDDCNATTYIGVINALNNSLSTDFNLYPNPVVDHIKLPAIHTWSVLNSTGHVLMQGNSETINTELLQAGIYFIQIENGNSAITKKFIKQ